MDHLRYPIGHFVPISNPTIEERNYVIDLIPDISKTLKEMTGPLNLEQLQTAYRPDGWTIQQVVHHIADNDMNAYLRFKRALTEDEPLASSYREDSWAELGDYKEAPIETSITLLESLHSRFYILLRNLGPDDFIRTLRTQLLGVITVDTALQRFVWHNQHHMAQIHSLLDRKRW
jgi:uncharacterized damage-inducible protein DinB